MDKQDGHGWKIESGGGTFEVTATGLYIDGEFFEDDPAPEVQTDQPVDLT